MYIKTALVLLSALASTAFIVGCGSGGTGGDGATTGTQRASLHRAKTCPDLLGDLTADAIYKLNHGIDRQIEVIRACQARYSDERCNGYGGYGGVPTAGGGDFASRESASDSAAPPASAGASSSSGGTGDASKSASSYSETNTQVKGVDEADIVKNDGKYLYVLHGRAFKMLNAWPANELKEVGTLDIEGQPTEMFVADNKVVVYSSVNGASIFAAAGVPTREIYSDFGYGYGGGGVARADVAIAPSPPGGGYVPPSGPYIPLTKVTVMKLEGATPVVTREVYFEGGYLDARRVGPHVRTVLQGNAYGPKLKYSTYELYPQPYIVTDKATGATTPNPEYREDQYPKTGTESIAALEKLRAENINTLKRSVLADWLPYTFVKDGAGVKAQRVACEDFYVPTTGTTESGITEVASLDLGDPAATPKESAILGRADTVYGNADTLYLAAHAWVEPPFFWNDPYEGTGGGEPAPPPETAASPGAAPRPAPGGKAAEQNAGAKEVNVNVDLGVQPRTTTTTSSNGIVTWSTNTTHIHKFDFASSPTFPNYVASGTVNGSIKNQFSLDDKDGFLRIATTENRQYVTTAGKYVPQETAPVGSNTPPARPNTVNHVFVLEQKGPWLEQTGVVGELAPNEQIYSVRFVDNRGYVVTFRQVDPLFVVDLATPSSPKLLAALKIPGFSDYMHPLDSNHLLTIGRDGTETGRVQGLQLKIFDVTDGANPRVQFEHTYRGDEYGSSEAQFDHKAFTYFAEKGLLAFPYQSYGQTMRSSLELFRVDLVSGFTKLGSIDHTPLFVSHQQGYCGGYYTPQVRRGVFLENFVYSVSYGGVVVKDANALNAPTSTAELALPSPLINDGYGPACYVE